MKTRPLIAMGIAVTAAALLLGSVSRGSAHATATASAAGKVKVWYVNPLFSYPLWLASSNVFKKAAKAHGYSATVVGNNQIDIPKQINAIKQAVSSGADGVITCDLNPATFQSTIQDARSKGVVMVTIGCVDKISDYAVGTDNVSYGKLAADEIAKHAGKDAQVVVVATDKTTPNQALIFKTFQSRAKAKYPKMKVLAYESDNSNPAKAAQIIQTLPSAYPGMDTLWMIEGTAPATVRAALSRAGKKAGDIYTLGVDALPTTIAAIKSGWITETLVQCWFYASPFAADLIKAKKAGHGPKKQFWPINIQPVTKAQLPFKGCPASFLPKLPK